MKSFKKSILAVGLTLGIIAHTPPEHRAGGWIYQEPPEHELQLLPFYD